ncbi:NepR family anti-sigma factor [Mangrovibrevibacter kandeliae]|uniref:NepR family anti-sigma factor n=1 Tax=Mangrovibrevibacter kandeliae TaxID=2968473 RepID=UPI0021188AAA|nr:MULTISPECIES: NepR family anti-sigma factor [unclassified Aurantimonas]MCQ8780956.1 NepR family anti-sigma factor [Aurantimonas sp. CSK15Z-1]MCW4113737.1 NepR family anti-sigma factor [Aurantimonas sp. MSK8Z-1]
MSERKTEDETLQSTVADHQSRQPQELGPNSVIGRRLKAYYDDVASEPVPDRFLLLLDALDQAESGSSSDRG